MSTLPFLSYLRGIYKLNLEKSSRVHNAIIQSIYDCFIMSNEDINLMRLEMCLKTASGYWLNCWGEYFSVYRKSGEDDETYSKRIISSIIQPKSTIPAIKDNIVNYLNSTTTTEYTKEDILIREPWKEVAKYSHKGLLSKDARFFSSDYYCHAILDISIPENVTSELIDIVASIKAAGVKVLWSTLNQYDIVDGFFKADESWSDYHRRVQLRTERNQYSGLVLSNSSPNPVLSGLQKIWTDISNCYSWYAVMLGKKTDESIILTKKDLIGLLDYFLFEGNLNEDYNPYEEPHLVLSDKGGLSTQYAKLVQTIPENWVEVSDELVSNLSDMDNFLTLSEQGGLSSSKASMFEYTSSHSLYGALVKTIDEFKELNPDYYNSVQPPILNGEQVMWFVDRNVNFLLNNKLFSNKELYDIWSDYEENSHQEITTQEEFEQAYVQHYIEVDDCYQAPIIRGKPFYWASEPTRDWMYDSVVFTIGDLEELYQRQLYTQGVLRKTELTLGDLIRYEEYETSCGYSIISKEQQPTIEIKSTNINM